MDFNIESFRDRIAYWIDRETGDGIESSNDRQVYEAVSRALLDSIWEKWRACERNIKSLGLKRVYYLSVEFLMGRALGNNLINLGLKNKVREVLQEMKLDLNAAEEAEPDAALGNGGLGRLAACFIESLATLNLPARGYGIRYRYGMFRQVIINGEQVEQPDDWIAKSDPWSVRRGDRTTIVRFGGRVETESMPDGGRRFRTVDTEDILAVPYDMPIIGWDTDTIGTLRLWEAESVNGFDLQLFNEMEYSRSVEPQNRANDLSRVLYPNDNGPTGKTLRLRQQYFFSSASLQDVIREYKWTRGSNLSGLPDMAAIQLNDTHPVIAIPELMRLLMDEEGMGWDEAWSITTRIFAYTNHTVLPEALESWPINLFRDEFPRLIQIVEEINRRFMASLSNLYPEDPAKYKQMSIFSGGMIRMAHLAIIGSFSVNGVAALHTEILKTDVLKNWHRLWPEKFSNKTNGVTHRRWLKKSNPGLSGLLDEIVGPNWTRDLSKISVLKNYVDEKSVLERLSEIKKENKQRLANLVHSLTGIEISSSSLFDIQIKRLHEYKRQLLNILSVLHDWQALKDNPSLALPPRVVFFGAKAASGYRRAKQIIRLIHAVAEKINNDSVTSDRLKVVFVPNYRVSLGEVLFPAAEISQQISTAGKEASGTGNMKFMMNGALTLGTMDGANIEIAEEAGMENVFIFGMNSEEVLNLSVSGRYNPLSVLQSDPTLKKAMDALVDGTLPYDGSFVEIYDSLVYGTEGNQPDQYFVLEDFASYRDIRNRAGEVWKNPLEWNRMSLLNIAGSGPFSSDRTIKDYAKGIWKIVPIK